MLLKWDKIDEMDSYHISYLLYLEGKSIEIISKIRNIPKKEVEKHIIKGKIVYKEDTKKEDQLIKIISMEKSVRIKYLNKLSLEEKDRLVDEIYKRYIKFKNVEDRMILIWVIGELNSQKLLPFLRMELKSKNVNFRRLSCSALGKIGDKSAKPWLEKTLKDSNPQVRQYAIKALSIVGDEKTLSLLHKMLKNKAEKPYVKKAIKETIDILNN